LPGAEKAASNHSAGTADVVSSKSRGERRCGWWWNLRAAVVPTNDLPQPILQTTMKYTKAEREQLKVLATAMRASGFSLADTAKYCGVGAAATIRRWTDMEYKERERAWYRAYQQTPEFKAWDRARKQTPEAKARERARQQTPEFKAWNRARMQTPEFKAYLQDRFANDPQYKLAHLLRVRLHAALKGNFKTGSAVRDLGCSVAFLKQHLESQFKPGMTWENHGPVWHIDHIKPLASFDLTNREQLLEAVNWRNLQPLFAVDNIRKGARLAPA
jgi:hypothetical protein